MIRLIMNLKENEKEACTGIELRNNTPFFQ